MSTLKLGLSAWGFRQLTIREYFDAAARLGLPLVELNCRPDVLAHAWVDFSQEDLSEILDCASAGHIEIVALSARNDFTHADPTRLNSQAAQLRRIIESAAHLRARFVRVLIGQDPQPSQAVRESALRKLQEAGKFAETLGLKLALENGNGPLLRSDDCLEVLHDLSAFPIGLVFNPANFARHGEDPVQALAKLAKHICYSHLADWDGHQVCPVGKGQIDFPALLALLSQSDADVALIEYPHPDDVELGTAASQKKLTSLLRTLARKQH